MTQREGPASGSVTQVAPRPVVAPATSAAGAVRAETPPRTPSWDDLFRALSPAQQQELLGLARRQGLLYAHQIPAANNGTPADQARALLGKILGGRTEDLTPLHPAPVDFVDTALDAAQRGAVAGALHTPDLFLLQGPPGTGKSRVVTEIITQAALRGERVVLLAPTTAALDRVLDRLVTRPALCAVRCLDRHEKPETLPAAIRGLTFGEQVCRLREQTLQAARKMVHQRAEETRRLRRDETAGPGLLDLAGQGQELERRRQDVQQRSAQLSHQIEQLAAAAETGPAGTPFLERLRAFRQTRREAQARRDAQAVELHKDREKILQQVAELTAQRDKALPLAEAREHGRWWSVRWWQASVQGVTPARRHDLESQLHTQEAALAALEPKIAEAAQKREAEDKVFRHKHEQLVAEETARRQAALDAEAAALHKEQLQLEDRWNAACGGLAPGSPRPAALTAEAVGAARSAWELAIQQAAEEEAFAARWAEHLASAPDTLAERLPEFVNLVAATTSALAHDPQFGPGSRPFDLLILEEAEQVTESEFLTAARRARRWVLVGEPHDEDRGSRTEDRGPRIEDRGSQQDSRRGGERRRTGPPSQSSVLDPRSSILNRLWKRLHFDPSRLPYAWLQENNRLVCRLRVLTPQQRQSLEIERVADFPDIELRILTAADQPALAEVAFPPTMSIADAKRYIYHELQELPLRASGQHVSWAEDAQRLVLHLTDAPGADPLPVALEPGVRELVGAAGANGEVARGPWYTFCVEFDRAAGWHRQRAEEWLARHAGVRDLGRTARLRVHYRMNPDVAQFATSLLANGTDYLPVARSLGGPAGKLPGVLCGVEFVPVPALTRDRGGRGRDRGKPHDLAVQLAHMRGGAGLELSLDDGRHRDRIPTEVRATLPARGLVNYLEAQAVVRTLAGLAQDRTFTDGLAAAAAAEGVSPSVTVLALYPAQATLLRQLVQQEPLLAGARFHLDIETPAAYRHREALVVLLSLTRSHTHRAVPFGDGPQALALALTRARMKLLIFGDPGTLVRRTHWEGNLDHLDAAAAARERELLTQLVHYLQGQGPHPQVFSLREGNPA